MSENNSENNNTKGTGTGAEDTQEKPFRFLNERRKKTPIDGRRLAGRILLTCAIAVGGGILGAFIFAKMLPVFQGSSANESIQKVEIVSRSDDITPEAAREPSVSPTPAPSEAPAASVTPKASVTPAASVTPDPSASVTPEPSPEPSAAPQNDPGGTEPEKTEEMDLADYRLLYREMLEASAEAQQSVVQVIGITSEMDYFNRTYENQQQISGLIIAESGTDFYVLTEHRIADNIERIQVTFCDGAVYDANYVSHDTDTGLTVIRVPKALIGGETMNAVAAAPLGSSRAVTKGEPVIAIGSPLGYSDSVAFGVVTSVTNTVSAVDNQYNILTTDILGSKSGSGILVNLDGSVVGIIAQQYSQADMNVVTALGVSEIKQLMETLSNNEKRIYIGIKGQNVTADISERTGIPVGVYITSIEEDSPAFASGLKESDVIIAVGGGTVSTMRSFTDAIADLTAGRETVIRAMRKGSEGYAEVEFRVVPGER